MSFIWKVCMLPSLHCYIRQMARSLPGMCSRSVQKISSHVMWKIETFIEEDRRYKKHCTQDNNASVPFKVSTLGLPQFSQSPSAAPSYFPKSHQWYEIFSLSKVILVLGKARSHKTSNLGFSGAESSGWFDVSPENSVQDVMYERACCHDEAANHQLPIVAAFWTIPLVSLKNVQA